MFPAGTAGAALFILRVSIAVSLLVDGTAHWALTNSFWAAALFVLPAGLLCLGFLTPYCAGAGLILQLIILAAFHGPDTLHLSLSMVNCGVLAVLGPGAYSIDARLFGRRIVSVLPRK
jgi:uncharacterized membrane protein YphA (DoxX/SURF4 family)